jgi:hypothetical protein
MDALDFSSSQGRTTQLLHTQQLPNSAFLQPKQPNPPQQDLCIMELDPNGYLDSYAALATDCKHFVQYSSAPTSQLSPPAVTHGEAPDWEDECEPDDFVSVPANTLLCNTCEQAIRTELRDAKQAYDSIWASVADIESGEKLNAAGRAASLRFVKASIKVANFEGRMADLENTKEAKEQKWEAGKKVKFAVAKGEGAGEKPKEKKNKSRAIPLGWVEVDQPAASPSTKKEDTSYVFSYRPSIFTYRGDK